MPVNPLAGTHRHAGLGFTGYILVLTNRPSTPPVEPPTPAVAWLTSRFHDQYVVVVEGGSAAVWKGRALRGVISVDTRTDFWRLLAHSAMTVDLAPGEIIARECIESLRFGTPIVVPSGTVGAMHAASGGGLAFSDTLGLLDMRRPAPGRHRTEAVRTSRERLRRTPVWRPDHLRDERRSSDRTIMTADPWPTPLAHEERAPATRAQSRDVPLSGSTAAARDVARLLGADAPCSTRYPGGPRGYGHATPGATSGPHGRESPTGDIVRSVAKSGTARRSCAPT